MNEKIKKIPQTVKNQEKTEKSLLEQILDDCEEFYRNNAQKKKCSEKLQNNQNIDHCFCCLYYNNINGLCMKI